MEIELYAGFMKLHILYHADKESIFGLWIIEELRRHGYEMSPGTLYPILHRMEKSGYLQSKKELVSGKIRRLYTTTPSGHELLVKAKEKARELFGELFEED